MNNMRRGFTMIELVFVIVIIGILAAVALPRFTGIADDSHVSKVQSFVGTLNRTVAPSMWSGIQRNYPAANGSVKTLSAIEFKYATIFDPDTSTAASAPDANVEGIPSELTLDTAGIVGTGIHDIPLAGCAAAGTAIAGAATGPVAYTSIAGTLYTLGCVDGSLSASPHFFLSDGTTIITK